MRRERLYWWFLADPLDWLYAAAAVALVFALLNLLGE